MKTKTASTTTFKKRTDVRNKAIFLLILVGFIVFAVVSIVRLTIHH
jgi:hypothetical protein